MQLMESLVRILDATRIELSSLSGSQRPLRLRAMTKDEIARLSPHDTRPALGPVRYINRKPLAGTPIPVKYCTLGLRPSRYMPHIGAKERARHAGKPDGLMHTPVGGLL